MTTSKRTKVAHVITGLNMGGAERALYNLLASDFSTNFECSVISLLDDGVYGEKIRGLGVPVYTLNMRGYASIIPSLIRLKRAINTIEPEILHGWMYHGNVAAIFGKYFFRRVSFVVWNIRHSLYDIKREKISTRLIIKIGASLSSRADSIIYNSKMAQLQHERIGFSSTNSVVNVNGFDTKLLQPSSGTRASVRNAMGIAAETKVIGHVARYHPMKDHVGFIKAMIEVFKQFPDVEVLVVGREVRPNIEFLLHDLPSCVTSKFHFLGQRSDVYDLMQSMDVFCLSSAWGEGFPNVLGEAMCMQLPCVTTDVAESADIVGETGRVIPPNSPEELTRAMLDVLRLPATERAAKGRAARERINRKFLMEFNIHRYQSVYECLLENKRSE